MNEKYFQVWLGLHEPIFDYIYDKTLPPKGEEPTYIVRDYDTWCRTNDLYAAVFNRLEFGDSLMDELEISNHDRTSLFWALTRQVAPNRRGRA
jgi:hypothetical protein